MSERLISKRRARILRKRGEDVWCENGQWVWDWQRPLPFNKLSDSAKQYAIEHYNVANDTYYWSEWVIDDAKEQAAEQGFDIDNIYWSGFYSQGDGASWDGRVDLRTWCLKHIEDDPAYYTWAALAAQDEIESSASISTSVRYSHENSMNTYGYTFEPSGEVYDHDDFPLFTGVQPEAMYLAAGGDDAFDALQDAILESARDYAKGVYARLEEEYDYQTGEECFRELAAANNWLFDETGEMQ